MTSPDPDSGDRKRERYAQVRGIGLALTIGPLMGACLLVGYGLGWLSDRYLGTGDAGVAVGLILGMLAGFVEVVRMMRLMSGGPGEPPPS